MLVVERFKSWVTNATRRAENECSSAVDILEYETRKTMRCVKKKKKGYVSNIDISAD